MYISAQKKKENIAEYILYMWQIEDIIRAYKLDIDLINEHIIDKYDLPDEKKKDLLQWYEQLIEMMRTEGITSNGHLQINNNIIIDLSDVHIHLLNNNEPGYSANFNKVLPIIQELKTKQNSTIENDIEVCFSFLYGILLLKLQQKEISKETELALTVISQFIAFLALKYKDYKEGKLALD